MGYTSVFLAKSETFREAVMANYLGQLDDAGVQMFTKMSYAH